MDRTRCLQCTYAPEVCWINVWARTTQKLCSTVAYLSPEHWILVPGVFPAIVDKATFDRTQTKLWRNADRQWTDRELLRKLKRLLAVKGRLSESIILKARGMPAIGTLHHHFGSYKDKYALIDYHPPSQDIFRKLRRRSVLWFCAENSSSKLRICFRRMWVFFTSQTEPGRYLGWIMISTCP